MENPASWKSAELVISDALDDFGDAARHGMVGASNIHTIADRLRASGHISDADEPEIGWDKLRAHHAARATR